jgi:hypothetical protein
VFDQDAEPDIPLPDHVPDELVARYGAKARRTVHVSRSWRYPLARHLRGVRTVVRDGDLWLLTLMVFAWSIVAAGAVGALIYAAIAFPFAALYIVLPVLILFAVSFGTALRITRKQSREPDGSEES